MSPGRQDRLEAVLANEDALLPGEYPARVQSRGRAWSGALDKSFTVTIAKRTGKSEPPLAMPLFRRGGDDRRPAGRYLLTATFERGAAAAGGRSSFT